MFFSSRAEVSAPYRLLIDCARFGDQAGFEAIWLPERHFVDFGGHFSAPAVLCGALALVTERLSLRAGSVVVPLQDPVRIVEQWSVVDNLSGGRAAFSCAAGWHPDDFCLAPDRFASRRQRLIQAVVEMESLWQGKPTERVNGVGRKVSVTPRPRPVQRELPLWITAVGRETFELAGALGANLLTGAIGMDLAELADRIAAYRRARMRNSRGGRGRVTLMQHTFVADDADQARKVSLPYLKTYLASFLDQSIKELNQDPDFNASLHQMDAEDRDVCLTRMAEAVVRDRSLVGDREGCRAQLELLADLGVDEVACLVDFGPSRQLVLEGLSRLATLVNAQDQR